MCLSGVSPCPISPRPRVFLSPRPLPNPQPLNKFSQTYETTTGKLASVAYNRNSGDACFRSLLTPHSARTEVRALPYVY
jgi:hypothetical protein